MIINNKLFEDVKVSRGFFVFSVTVIAVVFTWVDTSQTTHDSICNILLGFFFGTILAEWIETKAKAAAGEEK